MEIAGFKASAIIFRILEDYFFLLSWFSKNWLPGAKILTLSPLFGLRYSLAFVGGFGGFFSGKSHIENHLQFSSAFFVHLPEGVTPNSPVPQSFLVSGKL